MPALDVPTPIPVYVAPLGGPMYELATPVRSQFEVLEEVQDSVVPEPLATGFGEAEMIGAPGETTVMVMKSLALTPAALVTV